MYRVGIRRAVIAQTRIQNTAGHGGGIGDVARGIRSHGCLHRVSHGSAGRQTDRLGNIAGAAGRAAGAAGKGRRPSHVLQSGWKCIRDKNGLIRIGPRVRNDDRVCHCAAAQHRRDAVGLGDREIGRKRYRSDLVGGCFREDQRAARPQNDVGRSAAAGETIGEFLDGAARRDPADLARSLLREPQCAIGTTRDSRGTGVGGRGGEFVGDDARRRNPPDLAGCIFVEPQSAVRAAGDVQRTAAGARHTELGDGAGGRDPADLIRAEFGEPESPVVPHANPERLAAQAGHREFRDRAGQRNPADLIGASFGEPEIAVEPRTFDDRARSGA